MPCSSEEVKINSILAIEMMVGFIVGVAFELGNNW